MDDIDRKILKRVQQDSSESLNSLAEKVVLSPSACHRRLRQLEEAGHVQGYRAELNPKAIGLEVEVLVQITLSSQQSDSLEEFEKAVKLYDEILECWLLAGQADYVLRIMAKDIDDYNRIHRHCLSRLPGVASMQTSFSLRRIKPWRGYAF